MDSIDYNDASMKPTIILENLRAWLYRTRDIAEGDVLIDELCIVDKTCRADLVHANGKLTGFEVKSAADNLKRWPAQMAAYQSVFDEVWLCCHWRHAPRALDESNETTGIIIIDEFSGMAVLRPAKLNGKVDPYHLTGLLWREQLNLLCQKNDLPVMRTEKIKEARQRIADALPINVIQQEVLAELKLRYK